MKIAVVTPNYMHRASWNGHSNTHHTQSCDQCHNRWLSKSCLWLPVHAAKLPVIKWPWPNLL